MKNLKAILFSCCIALSATSITGCAMTYQESLYKLEEYENRNTLHGGYFTTINHWYDDRIRYYIVYANDTKVKYFILQSSYHYGITPLYNADGSLQIYNEDEK